MTTITREEYGERWGQLEEAFHAVSERFTEQDVTDALDNMLGSLEIEVEPHVTKGAWSYSQECDIGNAPHQNIWADGVCIAQCVKNKADAKYMAGSKRLVEVVVEHLEDYPNGSAAICGQLKVMGVDEFR